VRCTNVWKKNGDHQQPKVSWRRQFHCTFRVILNKPSDGPQFEARYEGSRPKMLTNPRVLANCRKGKICSCRTHDASNNRQFPEVRDFLVPLFSTARFSRSFSPEHSAEEAVNKSVQRKRGAKKRDANSKHVLMTEISVTNGPGLPEPVPVTLIHADHNFQQIS